VSKALNNSDGLAEATRQRIIQKAAEMGYKQFALLEALPPFMQGDAAGSLPAARPGKNEIALLSTVYLATPHFSSLMLDAFHNQISKFGYNLNTHRVTEENIATRTLPRTFDLERVAAILCIEMFDFEYDEMICGLGVPTLFVDGPARLHGENLPSDQLYMENTTQVMKLVNEMVSRGIERIGFIGEWGHCQSFFERYAAFRLAMLTAGKPVSQRWCIHENHVAGIAASLSVLDELPELFVCANDFVALDALQALRSMGLDVPRDVLLAGFDDAAESRRCMPQLTTIHIHTQSMAYSAMHLLITRMQEPNLEFRQVYTQTDLIYRESTDPEIGIERENELI
jgi:LacI family transcriptional regulator